MQYRKLEWGAKRTTENVNQRLIEVITPGVYAGYYVKQETIASMNLDIAKNLDTLQALISNGGELIIETDDLPAAVTIPTADATNPRIDLVVARHTHTPAQSAQTYEVIEGTAAPSPVAPTALSTDIVLAQVAVAAGVTVINQSDISAQASEKSPFTLVIAEDGIAQGRISQLNVGTNLDLTVVDGVGTISLGAGYGTTYVQDLDPSTVAGGSHNITEGDRWLDTSGGAGLIVMWVAASDWLVGAPTDWVKWEREQHAPEHELGGNDEVDPLLMKNVGNNSGEVPVSNGSLNTNLDADLLDGQHASEFADKAIYDAHDHSAGDPTQVAHVDTSGQTVDDHHDEIHILNSAKHTGDLGYAQLDSLVDISGSGSPSMISGAQHQHTNADGSTKVGHANLTGLSANNHHNQVHALNGGDHSGDLAYSQLDSIVDISGGGASNLISRADHVHTAGDGSAKVTHSNLQNLTIGNDHTQYALKSGSITQITTRNHSDIQNIGASDHHTKFDTADHALVNHLGIPGAGVTAVRTAVNSIFSGVVPAGGATYVLSVAPIPLTAKGVFMTIFVNSSGWSGYLAMSAQTILGTGDVWFFDYQAVNSLTAERRSRLVMPSGTDGLIVLHVSVSIPINVAVWTNGYII